MEDYNSKRIFLSLLNFPKNMFLFKYYLNNIRSSGNYDECALEVEKVYKMMKKTAAYYYNDLGVNFLYDLMKKRVLLCESILGVTSITDVSTNFFLENEKYIGKTLSDFKETQDILDFIVWLTRKNIFERFRRVYGEGFNFDDIDLTNECLTVSVYIELLCKKYGIECLTIKILPAYTDRIKLYDGNGYHYFNLIIINSDYYLMDCTYKQFFKMDENLFERMGVLGLNGVSVGAYMNVDHRREKVAKDILKNGWIKADKENMKNYFDGFTLSFRNGLYYEIKGDINYSVDYSIDDYKRFIWGDDDLFKHEPYYGLGVQTSPLEDYKLDFKPRKR